MSMPTVDLRICDNGHRYYKSSDCPVCPVCEAQRKPEGGFLSLLSAPARRALESNGIKTPEDLAAYTEGELLKLHGFGAASLPTLRAELEKAGLSFNRS